MPMVSKQRVAFVGDGALISRLFADKQISSNIIPVAIYARDVHGNKFPDARIRPAEDLNTIEEERVLESMEPDFLFSIGNFDVIVSRPILRALNGNAINLHYGLLPYYGGRHGYQWAIRNGEAQSGVTLHSMTHPFDSGRIISTSVFDISEVDTGLSVYKKCVTAGRKIAEQFLLDPNPSKCSLGNAQTSGLRKIYYSSDIGTGEIDFDLSAREIRNFVRAADFRPFQSPSYVPWYRDRDGREYQVYSCRVCQPEELPGADDGRAKWRKCRDGYVIFDHVREKNW